MQKQAKGQITLISVSDGSNYTFFLNKNKSTEQIYDSEKGSYTPDYTTSPLVFTPSLALGGVTVSGASFSYTINGETADGTTTSEAYTQYGAVLVGNTLEIRKNMSSVQYVIICTATFKDPNSGNTCNPKVLEHMFRRDNTGGSKVFVLFDNTDQHAITTDHKSVTMNAYVIYGGTEGIVNKNDSSNLYAVLYKWSIYNSSANAFVGFDTYKNTETQGMESTNLTTTGYTGGENGTYSGDVVVSTAKYYKVKEVATDEDGDKKVTYFTTDNASATNYDIKLCNNQIVINADAVNTIETFRCEAVLYSRDNTKVAASYGSDSTTEDVRDLTDNYGVEISSSSLQFTSTINAIKLTANVTYKGVVDTDAYSSVSYDWDGYNIDGNINEDDLWKEYDSTGETEITSAEEGQGYWILYDASGTKHIDPTCGTLSSSGKTSSVTIYKSSISSGAAKFICTATITL